MNGYLNFIDISSWQAGLNLEKLFEQNNLEGVIVKATGGVSGVQATCDPWVQTLKRLNKPWGFYHYLNDDSRNSSPKEEAFFFVKNCENYFHDGMPWVDYEARALNFGTAYLLEFLETVETLTGVKCGVYCSLSVIQSQDFSKIAAKGYPLWVAQYANNSVATLETEPWQRGSFAPFARYVMHQYSDNGRLTGYAGPLDLDRYYGTRESWEAMLGKAKEVAPEEPKLNIKEELIALRDKIASLIEKL